MCASSPNTLSSKPVPCARLESVIVKFTTQSAAQRRVSARHAVRRARARCVCERTRAARRPRLRALDVDAVQVALRHAGPQVERGLEAQVFVVRRVRRRDGPGARARARSANHGVGRACPGKGERSSLLLGSRQTATSRAALGCCLTQAAETRAAHAVGEGRHTTRTASVFGLARGGL